MKEFGGLGIPNIKELNISWNRRNNQDDGKIWKTIIDYKYISSSPNFVYLTHLMHLDFGDEFWK
jgi:hypothetical protein